MIEKESFEEENEGIAIDFRPLKRGDSTGAPLIGRNSWYNDMCRRIPDTNTGKFKDIFRNPYEDGRPLTYFLYPGLSWEKLEDFLHRQNATIECIERAEINLENYNYQRMVFIERKVNEGKKKKGVNIIQSDDDVGKSNQSGEEEVDSKSGYEQGSQLEDGQESSESEHERSQTLSSEDSQSEGEVEYNVLHNEELHGVLELEKYRLQTHEGENIQTELSEGKDLAPSDDPTSVQLQAVIDNSNQDNGGGRVAEPNWKLDDAVNLDTVDQTVENNSYSEVQAVQVNDDTSANPCQTQKGKSIDTTEDHSEIRIATEFVSKNINSDLKESNLVDKDKDRKDGDLSRAFDDENNQSNDKTNDQQKEEADNQPIDETENKPENEEDNQSEDETENKPENEENNQSEDEAGNQSEDEAGNQSEGDVSSHSDGTFGSCHSDREHEISDEEHEFIGSYKSDDTYTSCHSDEVFTESLEEATQHTGSSGQPPIRIIKSKKSPSLFRPK